MIPVDLATLEEIALIRGCHERFLWIMKPENVVFSTLFSLLLSMMIERLSRLIIIIVFPGW